MCMMILKADADTLEQIMADSLFKDLALKQNAPDSLTQIRTIGVEISTAPQHYLNEQIEEVLEFLHLYEFELKRIVKHPGVHEIMFNFRVALRIDGDKVCAQLDRFTADLLHEIGKYGASIGLTKHSKELYSEQ